MSVIYLDVLIFTNFIISISFLLLTKKLTHTYSPVFFTILGAIIGSLSSVVILIESTLIALAVKILVMLLQISVCFKTKSIKKISVLSLVYFIINISYSGLCIIFWNIFDKKLFYIKNLTVYFDVDTGMLIGLVIIIYVIISIYEYLTRNKFDKFKKYTVKCTISGNEYTYKGIADTGNALVDYYYSVPVAVITSDKLYEDLKLKDENYVLNNKLHLLPCSTINGEGYIYVTKPMKVEISDGKTSKKCEVCIGISHQENQNEKCIFNPKILI